MSELDDTLDEAEDRRPGRRSGPFERPTRSELEAADLANSEWGRALEAEVAAARAAAASADERAAKAEDRAGKMERRWKWVLVIVSTLAGAVTPIAVYAVKRLQATAEARGVAGEREATRLQDHADIGELKTGLAEVRGILAAISRLGAVRVQGPAPQPLVPGDAP
jgi:hypothetical protein